LDGLATFRTRIERRLEDAKQQAEAKQLAGEDEAFIRANQRIQRLIAALAVLNTWM
jgi:hypothetical protein